MRGAVWGAGSPEDIYKNGDRKCGGLVHGAVASLGVWGLVQNMGL